MNGELTLNALSERNAAERKARADPAAFFFDDHTLKKLTAELAVAFIHFDGYAEGIAYAENG